MIATGLEEFRGDLSPALQFNSVSVSFGPITALRRVSFAVEPGEILGLLGHNGAGKSSVVNVATGAVPLGEGFVEVDGHRLPTPLSPNLSAQFGIGVVHQEPALALNLSVFDNLFLGGKPPGKRADEMPKVLRALEVVQLDVPPDTLVGSLDLGERQLLDICRSSWRTNLRILFLDEPTAALGKPETDRLHSLIRKLSTSGTAIVYVSHRLRDVQEICSRFVVLRDGEKVADEEISRLTPNLLAKTLTGGVGTNEEPSAPVAVAKRSTSVVSVGPALSFSEGEIVGLFGMASGEQFDVLSSLFGVSAAEGMLLDGQPYMPRSPRDAIDRGLFMVQADREEESLLGNLSASENIFMPWLSSFVSGFGLAGPKMSTAYSEAREVFGIDGPDGSSPIGAFSGGNRQKHVLARWLVLESPRVLLLAQPTQGVDEASKADIRRVLRSYAEAGVVIIIASAESDEIARVCRRAYVFGAGGVSEVFGGHDFEEKLIEELLRPMASNRKVGKEA